jgi:hypothetical protein
VTRYADIPKPIRSGIVVVDPGRARPSESLRRSSIPTPWNAALVPVRRRQRRLRRRGSGSGDRNTERVRGTGR